MASVSQRFHIEDLIVQDASGVVFRAVDPESSSPVAVRRFFPFGPEGGGLHEEEQAAYGIAIKRLAGLSHPALRSVICGGCDPVDGMPFIVTEWVDGESLRPLVDEAPLSIESATELITQALEVCELLSLVLAEEAVWVQTDLQSIVLGKDQSRRRFTFWISPLKWLGGSTESRKLDAIVSLTEEIMGWEGQILNDQAGRGLGSWLKWLRGVVDTASLTEVREMLAASIGVDPPDRAGELVAKATQPMVRSKAKALSTAKAWVLIALGLLIAAGIAGGLWLSVRKSAAAPALADVKKKKKYDPNAELNRRAAELSAEAAGNDRESAAILSDQQAQAEQNGGVIPWQSHEWLVENHGKKIVVEGTLESFRSPSKVTLYLQFSKTPDRNDALGVIKVKTAPADLSEEALAPLRGKKVRLSGKVSVRRGGGLLRPEIRIINRASIEIVE